MNVAAISLMQSNYGGPEWELACDEVLLERCEAGEIRAQGILRFWEPNAPFIVIGYSNKAALEANALAGMGRIPVLRRCSGGGSVLQGPGCLNYALVLPIDATPEFASITDTNCFIMSRNRDAIAPLVDGEVRVEGYTDLTLNGRKFSGNSQRRKNHCLLFHGTFLLQCDFELMEKVLPFPPRTPEYRKGRKHSEFLTTLSLSAERVKDALIQAWNAKTPLTDIPLARIEALIDKKYSRMEWNFRS
jgi:lipoate-protein ligase A